VKPAEFLVRRAAAYQAYYEHQPLRRLSVPKGPDMLLYRRSRGETGGLPRGSTRVSIAAISPVATATSRPAESLDPSQTILGAAQRDWLFDGLQASVPPGTSWRSRS